MIRKNNEVANVMKSFVLPERTERSSLQPYDFKSVYSRVILNLSRNMTDPTK